jgi:hypothetical protein
VGRPPEIAPLGPEYGALYDRLVGELRMDARVRSVDLGGSLRTGGADRWSDLDLVVRAADGAADELFGSLPSIAARAAPLVFSRAMSFADHAVFVAVTQAWLRLDVVVHGTKGGAANAPVDALRSLVEEFLRVLGLLPAVAGRREWIVASDGAMLLRSLLVALLLAENGEPPQTGAKRLNEKLRVEQRMLVEGLPAIAARREDVLAAHAAIARVFLDRARPLTTDWPRDFEEATLAHLQRELGLDLR